MKAPSPALVVAVVALFVALGGTTYAATSLPKNSVGTKQLKNGAVTAQKISKAATKALKAGSGSILRYSANASASPTQVTFGTALGDTWAAECGLSSGHALLEVFVKTSNGAWHWQLGQEIGGSGADSVDSFDSNLPAGTLSTFQSIGEDPGDTAPADFELDDQGIQLAPVGGYLALHIAVMDTTAPAHTCQVTVSAMPEKLAATAGLRHFAATTTSTAQLLGSR
jgi:hypothetical protein